MNLLFFMELLLLLLSGLSLLLEVGIGTGLDVLVVGVLGLSVLGWGNRLALLLVLKWNALFNTQYVKQTIR